MTRALPAAADADTFDRSCAHWSADGREGMDNFLHLCDCRLQAFGSLDRLACFAILAIGANRLPSIGRSGMRQR